MKRELFLGGDTSKGYCDFTIQDRNREPIDGSYQLPDTATGRQMLRGKLLELLANGASVIYCGFESTGGYEDRWISTLSNLSEKVKVCRINPKAINAYEKASLTRSGNDAISSQLISNYLIEFKGKQQFKSAQFEEDNRYREGRKINKSTLLYQKQINQLSNHLEKLLYQYLPTVLNFCRKSQPKWVLDMLSKYPSASKLRKVGISRLCKIKGLSKAKATKLIQGLKDSDIASNENVGLAIKGLVSQIKNLKSLVEVQDQFVIQTYRDLKGVELLESIQGVGLTSAVKIMLEIEDIKHFSDVKQLCSYFGVHPILKTSGDGRKKSRMSKQGRSAIRGILYNCCFSALKWNPLFRTLYDKHRAKGKKHYEAMGVLMHKMLRIIYGMLIKERKFDPKINQRYQKRSLERKENRTKKTIKRESGAMINVDQNAPVSNRKLRQIKKRVDVPIG